MFVSSLKHESTLINFSFLESINNIDGANSQSKVLTKNFELTLSMHSKRIFNLFFSPHLEFINNIDEPVGYYWLFLHDIWPHVAWLSIISNNSHWHCQCIPKLKLHLKIFSNNHILCWEIISINTQVCIPTGQTVNHSEIDPELT